MNVVRDSKTFSFNFDCPKDVDGNLNHTSNESLTENKIRDWTIIIKYKHGNDALEHRKQQNKSTT